MNWTRLCAPVFALVLLASGCGGGSDSAELEALREEIAALKAPTTTVAPTTTDERLSSVEQAWIDLKTAEIGDGPYGLGQEAVSCALATLVEENGLDEARYQFDRDLPTREFARSLSSALVGCVDATKLISTLFFEDPDLEDLPIEFLDCIMKLVLEGDVVTDLFVMGIMEDPDSEVDRIMEPLLPELLVCMGESLSAEEIADLLPTTKTNEDEAGSTDDPQRWPAKIVFGFVPSQEQEQLQDNIKPLMDVLEAALGIEVEGIVTTDYTGLVTAMGTGQADLGAFGPFGYVLAQQQFENMEVLIQAVRYGSATYHGQWMTNDPSICDSPPQPGTALENKYGDIVQVGAIEAVALQVGIYFGNSGKALGETVDAGPVSPGMSCTADLSKIRGKRVAFTSESSTSGYIFPALQLIQAGINPGTDIVPIFSGGHDASVAAVYNGSADIGVAYDDARRSIRKSEADVGEKVVVFNITSEIPNDVVVVSSLLPDSLQTAVYNAIYGYLMTDEGEAVFDEMYGWTNIRRAVESDFDVVRQAAEALGITEP